MNFYTHAILANHLRPLVKPADPAEYLWGALVPDIRYLARLRRQTTHRPDEEIRGWLKDYPGHESFIQGYRIHCLLDSIDTARLLSQTFPLNLVKLLRRKPLSAQQAAVVIELHYHAVFPRGLALAGGHNPILSDLGIQANQSQAYRDALAGYLACPSVEAALVCSTQLGLDGDPRIARYLDAYHRTAGSPLLPWLLKTSVKNARLEQRAVLAYQALQARETMP